MVIFWVISEMSYKIVVGGVIAPWSLNREILVQIRCHIYSFKAYFTGN